MTGRRVVPTEYIIYIPGWFDYAMYYMLIFFILLIFCNLHGVTLTRFLARAFFSYQFGSSGYFLLCWATLFVLIFFDTGMLLGSGPFSLAFLAGLFSCPVLHPLGGSWRWAALFVIAGWAQWGVRIYSALSPYFFFFISDFFVLLSCPMGKPFYWFFFYG